MSKDVLGIYHSWSDDRFTVVAVGGAAAAEKEQKKQEHEVDTAQLNCLELGMLFPSFCWEGCGDPRNIGQPEE